MCWARSITSCGATACSRACCRAEADRPRMSQTAIFADLSPARRRLAFYVLLSGALLPSLNTFIVTIALPAIRAALDASDSETNLIDAGYSSFYAVCLVTGGRLGDLYGRRLMFVIGIAGFTVSSLLCGIASNA